MSALKLRFQTFKLFGFKHQQEIQDERFYYFCLNRYVTHLHIWKDQRHVAVRELYIG